jgi:peptidoglycan hydrolase-like protein with peptidoglycan-binding domain
VLTVLVAIALGALGIALLVAALEFRRRHRPASASSAREAEVAGEPTAVALAPVAAAPEPAAAQEPGPTPPDSGPTPPDSEPARVEQVKALQRQLGVLGFDPGPVDGHFGPKTTDAVKELQEVSGLAADGIVGRLTAEVLRRNAPGPPAGDRAGRVKALQHQLSWLGFEPGPADGRYGPLTTGAVKRFQQAHGLPADGIVDHATADMVRASIAQRPSSDRTDRVKELQRQLERLGLEPGAIDGRYGPKTTEAVRRFQEMQDLPAAGIVDRETQRGLQDSLQRTA